MPNVVEKSLKSNVDLSDFVKRIKEIINNFQKSCFNALTKDDILTENCCKDCQCCSGKNLWMGQIFPLISQ